MTAGTPIALLALFALIPLTAYVFWSKRPAIAVLVVGFFAALFAQGATDIVPHLKQAVVCVVHNIGITAELPVFSPWLIAPQQWLIADFCGRPDTLDDIIEVLDLAFIDE